MNDNPEAMAAMARFARRCTGAAQAAARDMLGAGVPEVAATTALAFALLDMAAGTACRTRRLLLQGEPDPVLWLNAASRAFDDAVTRTAPLAARHQEQKGEP